VERYIRLLSSQVKEYFTIFWSFPRAVAARALPLRLQQPIQLPRGKNQGGVDSENALDCLDAGIRAQRGHTRRDGASCCLNRCEPLAPIPFEDRICREMRNDCQIRSVKERITYNPILLTPNQDEAMAKSFAQPSKTLKCGFPEKDDNGGLRRPVRRFQRGQPWRELERGRHSTTPFPLRIVVRRSSASAHNWKAGASSGQRRSGERPIRPKFSSTRRWAALIKPRRCKATTAR
jgi:hypothetical protein